MYFVNRSKSLVEKKEETLFLKGSEEVPQKCRFYSRRELKGFMSLTPVYRRAGGLHT
jgi:hypothetical protein